MVAEYPKTKNHVLKKKGTRELLSIFFHKLATALS